MAFPNYPNPARRARILQAQELRQQGLTLRQIARIMDCSPSTVAGYLRDYELFRNDLIQELAADQIVSNLIQLGDVNDEHYERRLAAVREYRLLLAALPGFRDDQNERIRELVRGGVKLDHYGNRYPVPNRWHPPTDEEQNAIEQPPANGKTIAGRPNPDVPLAYIPEQDRRPPPSGEVSRSDGGGRPTPTEAESNDPQPADLDQTNPINAEQDRRPPPSGEVSRSDGGGRPKPTKAESNDPQPADPDQTNPIKPDQDSVQPPAHNGKSPDPARNSLSPIERKEVLLAQYGQDDQQNVA